MADRPDSARASAVRLRILESVRCAAAGFLSMAMSMGIQKNPARKNNLERGELRHYL